LILIDKKQSKLLLSHLLSFYKDLPPGKPDNWIIVEKDVIDEVIHTACRNQKRLSHSPADYTMIRQRQDSRRLVCYVQRRGMSIFAFAQGVRSAGVTPDKSRYVVKLLIKRHGGSKMR